MIGTIDEIVAFHEADTKQMAELIKTAQMKIEWTNLRQVPSGHHPSAVLPTLD